MTPPDPQVDNVVSAVERITALFRYERTAYLVLSVAAVLMLLGSAGDLLVHGRDTTANLSLPRFNGRVSDKN